MGERTFIDEEKDRDLKKMVYILGTAGSSTLLAFRAGPGVVGSN